MTAKLSIEETYLEPSIQTFGLFPFFITINSTAVNIIVPAGSSFHIF